MDYIITDRRVVIFLQLFWEVVNLHLLIWKIAFKGSLEKFNLQGHWNCLKKDPTDKFNSQTISILLLISKGFWESYIFNNYGTIWTSFWIGYFADFARLTLRNMSYLDHSRPGKKNLINVDLLALYLWIYLKRMTAYLMIYW